MYKLYRFGGRRHQVWLEPEGLDNDVVYPHGLSCTMPAELQLKMLRTIPALENVEMIRSGYGVEYIFKIKFNIDTFHSLLLFLLDTIMWTQDKSDLPSRRN